MFRTYFMKYEKEWDKGVRLILLAARKAVQESPEFSPFELVFGRTVRGPLKHLKEQLLLEETSMNWLDYVSDLHDNCAQLPSWPKKT